MCPPFSDWDMMDELDIVPAKFRLGCSLREDVDGASKNIVIFVRKRTVVGLMTVDDVRHCTLDVRRVMVELDAQAHIYCPKRAFSEWGSVPPYVLFPDETRYPYSRPGFDVVPWADGPAPLIAVTNYRGGGMADRIWRVNDLKNTSALEEFLSEGVTIIGLYEYYSSLLIWR